MQGGSGEGGPSRQKPPLAIVLIGVSGTGKTTVGQRLAPMLGATFLEGDAYHSSASVAKMRSGTPLDDADRWPWLARVGGAIAEHVRDGRPVVVACSALKRAYRDKLCEASRVPLMFIHLTIEAQIIAHRLVARSQHFMPPSLLQSQLEAIEPLEPEEWGTTIAETGTALQTVAAIQRWLRHPVHEKGRPSRPFPSLKTKDEPA